MKALSAWKKAERQAVIEAATGTGKTMLACAAIADVYQKSGRDTRVVIVVPTQVLASQWRTALVESLHLMDSWIGEQHSAATIEWRNSDHPVLITVINTGRNHLNKVLDTWKSEGRRTLLIVDECHRAGASTNAKIFEGHFDFSLGLSATPERPDEGEESHVYPNLGKKVFSYSLKSALDDGVLAKFTSVNLYVDFTTEEQRTWDRTSEDLGSAIRHFKHDHPLLSSDSPQFFSQIRTFSEAGDPNARRIEALLASRREVLASSAGRQNCLTQILPIVCATRKRFIVFHETISSAEATLNQLRELGVPSSIDHSMMKTDQRVSERQRFSRGTSQAMVAVRSLDEGVDVPEAEIAIIASGSRSKRQRIQRMGRVLRHREGKHAICVSILVRGTSEETVTGARDSDLVGPSRVRHHRHGEKPPIVALDPSSPSGHRPPQGGLSSEIDRLTNRFLLQNRTVTKDEKRHTV